MVHATEKGSSGRPIGKVTLPAALGKGNAFAAMADRVAGAIRGARLVGSSVAVAVAEVSRTALQEALEAGGDVAQAAKGIVVGVLRGTAESGVKALDTASQTARAVIRHAAQMGGDVSRVARGLVQGVLHCARDLGVEASVGAASVARAVLEEAEKFGSAAAAKVRRTFTRTVEGIRVSLIELPGRKSEP